jgi:hypothetical protein
LVEREIQAGKSEEENPLTEEIDNNEVHKKNYIALAICIMVVGCANRQL